MSETHKQAAKEAARKTESIASDGDDVRERTRKVFVDAVRNRDLGLDALSEIAGRMVDSAVDAVKSAAPKEQDSVLREVIDGIGDGFTTSANAARLALEEAKGRGETFLKEDVRKVTDNLRLLEEMFVQTVSNGISRGRQYLGGQASELEQHARRAASHMRPVLDDALHAALNHPVQFATEAARTGMSAAPRAAGALLQTMSGLLQGAGEVLTGERAGTARKSPGKKKGRKKSKKKAAAKKTSRKKKTGGKKTAKKKSAKKKTAKKKTAKKKSKKKAAKKKKSTTKESAKRKSKKKSSGKKKAKKKATTKKPKSRKKK